MEVLVSLSEVLQKKDHSKVTDIVENRTLQFYWILDGGK